MYALPFCILYMNNASRITILILRLSLGWVMFYAGITKVVDPDWSAAGYLEDPAMLSAFFEWLASPTMLPWVNQLNQWGLTFIGAALILGVLVRWASGAGILVMILYWLPILNFPYAGGHSFIIDDHIIYALVFVLLIVTNAGTFVGLDRWIQKGRRR